MTRSERDQALALAVVGAIAGVAGERFLGLLSPALIVAAVVAAVAGLIWFVGKRSVSEGGDTAGQVVVVALIGGVATFGATRLYQRSLMLLLAAIVLTFLLGTLVVRWARVKSKAAISRAGATRRQES